MINKKQTKNVVSFKTWYDSLPANEQIAIRDRILSDCEWSKPTFYRMLKNDNSMTKLEKIAINAIAGVDVFATIDNNIISKFKMAKTAN